MSLVLIQHYLTLSWPPSYLHTAPDILGYSDWMYKARKEPNTPWQFKSTHYLITYLSRRWAGVFGLMPNMARQMLGMQKEKTAWSVFGASCVTKTLQWTGTGQWASASYSVNNRRSGHKNMRFNKLSENETLCIRNCSPSVTSIVLVSGVQALNNSDSHPLWLLWNLTSSTYLYCKIVNHDIFCFNLLVSWRIQNNSLTVDLLPGNNLLWSLCFGVVNALFNFRDLRRVTVHLYVLLWEHLGTWEEKEEEVRGDIPQYLALCASGKIAHTSSHETTQ